MSGALEREGSQPDPEDRAPGRWPSLLKRVWGSLKGASGLLQQGFWVPLKRVWGSFKNVFGFLYKGFGAPFNKGLGLLKSGFRAP